MPLFINTRRRSAQYARQNHLQIPSVTPIVRSLSRPVLLLPPQRSQPTHASRYDAPSPRVALLYPDPPTRQYSVVAEAEAFLRTSAAIPRADYAQACARMRADAPFFILCGEYAARSGAAGSCCAGSVYAQRGAAAGGALPTLLMFISASRAIRPSRTDAAA